MTKRRQRQGQGQGKWGEGVGVVWQAGQTSAELGAGGEVVVV